MRKLMLSLQDLDVHTFATGPELESLGTAYAHQSAVGCQSNVGCPTAPDVWTCGNICLRKEAEGQPADGEAAEPGDGDQHEKDEAAEEA